LPPRERSAFLESVAAELASLAPSEIGPGSVGRIVRALWRDHFAAPDLSHDVSKYR
jgi:hypothetical protein